MLSNFLTHTCTLTRNGAIVAVGVPCLFQEGVLRTHTADFLAGMIGETTPNPRISFMFQPDTDVREHDQVSEIVFDDGTRETRRFAVQLVVTARRPRGGALTVTAFAKVT